MRLTPNVLFVEDDADTRELMAIILKSEDYQVVLAANYEEALLLARVMRFDLPALSPSMQSGLKPSQPLRSIKEKVVLFVAYCQPPPSAR